MQPNVLAPHAAQSTKPSGLPTRIGLRLRVATVGGLVVVLCGSLTLGSPRAVADENSGEANAFIKVDDVLPGMEGVGKTVLEGTEIVEFNAEVLGVMRGVAPGRDLVLCRLSGARLEYTGVIAGMSGSPIYIDGKLLGAVAYTWPFTKEPICGVTPIAQMRSLAHGPPSASATIEATAEGTMPIATLDLARDPFSVLQQNVDHTSVPLAGEAGRLTPIRMPLAASGFSEQSLSALRKHLAPFGLMPMATGGAGAEDQSSSSGKPIAPGSGMACSLIVGDFDLSAIGTATHVEGDRVWGWGHPFMSSGKCDYVLRSCTIHLVNARQDVSTKIGAALSTVGIVDADVSTCLAGRIGAEPDLLPVSMTVQTDQDVPPQEYHVRIVRHPTLLGPLVSTVLGNALETGGALSREITVELDATVRAEGIEPISVHNTYSGGSVAGSDGARRLLNQLATIADGLARNPFRPIRLESIECRAVVKRERTSAAIERLKLDSDRYVPGDAIIAHVRMRPYKSDPVDVELRLTLPDSIKPGTYNATVCDAGIHLKQLFAEQPQLLAARSVEQIADVFRLQLGENRQTLFLRVVTTDSGLALGEVNLPRLPSSARVALRSRRATGARPIREALVVRRPSDWVVEGSTNVRFTVVKDKKVSG